jgi:hypothetical protein
VYCFYILSFFHSFHSVLFAKMHRVLGAETATFAKATTPTPEQDMIFGLSEQKMSIGSVSRSTAASLSSRSAWDTLPWKSQHTWDCADESKACISTPRKLSANPAIIPIPWR